MPSVEVDGLHLAYERVGQGPPLVLLHGVLSDSRVWRRQLVALSDEFTVVAWDAPGCGESSDPPERFGLSDYADCLAAFIAILGLERPHILGLSWGGGLALQLYERKPALPRTLVLAAAYAGWAGSLPADVVAARLATCLREAQLPPSEFIPGWIPGLLTNGAPAELVEEVVKIMSEFHPVGYRVMIRGFAEADLRHVLPSIDIPTLLLYGDADKRSPLSIAHELHASFAISHDESRFALNGVLFVLQPKELRQAFLGLGLRSCEGSVISATWRRQTNSTPKSAGSFQASETPA